MALREVNLIPAEIIYKRHVRRHLYLWIGSLVILLGLIFGGYRYQLHGVLLKDRPRTTLEDMHMQLGATIDEIKLARQEIEQLSHQNIFLKTVNTYQPFSEVLLNLSEIINRETWLVRLVIISSPENESVAAGIQLHGYSLSNEQVGNFLNRLSETLLFNNVVLRYAKETQIIPSPQDSKVPITAVQFQIDCEIPRFKGSIKAS